MMNELKDQALKLIADIYPQIATGDPKNRCLVAMTPEQWERLKEIAMKVHKA